MAFLRGVMPQNCKMAELKRCVEAAGCTEVKTVLASGNVMFNYPARAGSALEQKIESMMIKELGRSFMTIIRSAKELQSLIAADPFSEFEVPPEAKRVVTFMRTPKTIEALPAELEGARILSVRGREAFTIYVRGPKSPVFMTLIEKTIGKQQTTRTWETVKKCATA